jgi:hypothetical protein
VDGAHQLPRAVEEDHVDVEHHPQRVNRAAAPDEERRVRLEVAEQGEPEQARAERTRLDDPKALTEGVGR